MKHTPTALERDICRKLNVSFAGIKVLLKACGQPDGIAWGKGFGFSAGGARGKLTGNGLIEWKPIPDLHPYEAPYITDKGREIVARARQLGL